ncbi:ALG6, ALG8 glycosyltransferase [Nadsonia fulvescens var. elongata DSM 6958]|uniref:Alpha-1,3-glucosyltransferase n=1 Tax=Nadsonia fulvescens var. elongata DSM 6958 TaxID=857566 RepID=A0A1E3PNH3_9ASCO|nr:ALG6, ALG8 glycosyltransferase [Nadsonia fulvescens var. elongata DSM 6958]
MAKLSLASTFIAAACLKVLLFDSYYSTDFEVHRNWMAITHNLPVKEWYTDHTSQWTLDYPPFFAAFEWVLSSLCPSTVVQDGALDLVSQGRFGWPTIAYQRTTVILSEIVLFAALEWYIKTTPGNKQAKLRSYGISASIVLSPGLLIIDHIHFQYNGFMYGIMIASLIAARNGRPILSGFLFSILLCFKHIYLYLAPAYFIYLLRVVVLDGDKLTQLRINWNNSIKLGLVVLSTFAVAFAPVIYYNQIDQLKTRLFPFSRGLTHAYWAPNIWALYTTTDKVLAKFVFRMRGLGNGGTRGIVGDIAFQVLPDITPKTTFLLTLFYQITGLVPLFLWPSFERFIGGVTLCGFASFLFGWHVHEKAILLVIFPFSFLVLRDRRLLVAFIPLTVSGYISLFPLIFTSGEFLLKTLYTFVWFVMFHLWFGYQLVEVRRPSSRRVFLLDRVNLIYMVGFIPIVMLGSLLDNKPGFEFLSLLIISIYSSIGVIGSWASFSWLYFCDPDMWKD